ncbi:histidine kinase [Cytophagales bacterium WSM2-2]|nr:histidine kinase [Cytophagales bacterium WSM2-2]
MFSQLTTKEGLSINTSNFVFQDSRGFIWIGTTDGLNLYTGNSIVVFRNNPKDSLSLPDNAIHCIAEDKNQNLWIASSSGLTRINLNSWKIEKVFRHTDDPGSIFSSIVLLIDEEGKIWTANIGIDLYDPSCDCFHHYVNESAKGDERQFRASNQVHSLFIDSRKRMWAGTSLGVYQFDLTTKKFSKPEWFNPPLSGQEPVGPIVNEIMEDHNRQMWLATWGSGLIKFSPDEKNIEVKNSKDLVTGKTTIYNVVDRIGESKTADGKYHLWVGTDVGFGEWDDQTNSFLIHQLRPGDYGGVKRINTDRSGIVWISTSDGGVYILDPYRQIFKTNFFDKNTFGPQPGFGFVNAIFSEGDTTWIATWYGNALYKFDRDFNLLEKWARFPPHSETGESLQGNHISRDKQGFLWISTLNGLHRLNTRTKEVKSFYHDPKDSTSLPSNKVMKYFEDSRGISWVCFYKQGICRFDPRTGKISDFHQGIRSKTGQLFNFYIWDILEDDDHNVWFADDGLGLWKYDSKQKELVATRAKGLAGHIGSLAKDGKTIWASTDNGLVEMNGDSTRVFTAADGLPSNSIYGAQMDQQGRLWVLTSQGLARYDRKKNIIRVFKQEDGLDKLAEVVFEKISGGRMAIGSHGFVTLFDPEKISRNDIGPQTYITQFKVFGKTTPWISNSKGKTVTLTYDQNQFSFDFAVLNYSNPTGNKFYHRMVGFDPDWVSDTQGFVNYTNLDAGEYTFKVKGANADGVMGDAGDFIIIRIIPPVWRTWWFILLCAMAIVGIIYIIYRIRVNQLLRLEKLRLRISTDLHDDMGSTLSSISILSNMALKSNEKAKEIMLNEIKDSSITLMERMDDIVWSINPRNDSLDRLMLRVGNFASKLFEAKGIDYQIEVPQAISNIKFPMEDRQHIYLIMKEAVNNLVKYSRCTSATIRVSLNPLTVEVRDNGTGFDTNASFHGNGIQSMKSRAQLLNAELALDSGPGKGTSVVLKMKIK